MNLKTIIDAKEESTATIIAIDAVDADKDDL